MLGKHQGQEAGQWAGGEREREKAITTTCQSTAEKRNTLRNEITSSLETIIVIQPIH